MNPDQRKITRREKRLFILTGGLVALVLLGGVWWRWLNAVPDVNIPTPKMPSPNAFDFYVKAARAQNSASQPEPTGSDFAASPQELARRYPTAAKEAWLATNAPALQLLRQGFAYRCQHPPVRSSNAFFRYSGFRQLARMMATQCHARGERGNWAGASQNALDILHLGHDIPRGGGVMAALVGTAIQSIGLKELSSVVPHLDAPATRAAARRLEKLYEQHVTFAAIMQEEKWITQAGLLESMRDPQFRPWLFRSANSLLDKSRAWFIPKQAIINNYTRMMDVTITNARQPYLAPRQPVPPADNPVTAELRPSFERTRAVWTRNETGNELLLVALALRAFRLEHGAYPSNLSELVPVYLKRIPADPFGGGELLRYRRTGSTYLLWSIGPDGVDNKGQAINSMTPSASESKRHRVQLESKGDMVAGINR